MVNRIYAKGDFLTLQHTIMKYKALLLPLVTIVTTLISCAQQHNESTIVPSLKEKVNMQTTTHTDTATFGAGCFWCVEAVFQQLEGVITVESGYSGGTISNPSYKEICTGTTGHAEVCRITFDPTVITYEELLQAFWQTHDPTTLNKQGNDVGTQYRSVVYYHNDSQKLLAEKYKKELDDAKLVRLLHFTKPKITTKTTLTKTDSNHIVRLLYAQR
jgi:peptide-methionine (S)-S-oxide reductase